MTEDMQTRAEVGAQVRNRWHADIFGAVAEAKLTPTDRVAVLELLESARMADKRETLGGARLLIERADSLAQIRDVPSVERRSRLLRRLAASFVHPPER
jgi:hypothetical protein